MGGNRKWDVAEITRKKRKNLNKVNRYMTYNKDK